VQPAVPKLRMDKDHL